jgi:hypothetical protein
MLAELEMTFQTNFLVIPNAEALEKMIPCPAFGEYFEYCLKKLNMEDVYNAEWEHDADQQQVYLRPMSHVTLDFKLKNFGVPSDAQAILDQDENNELDPEARKKVESKVGEKNHDQNIFLQKIQAILLHEKNGVFDFCQILSKVTDDKFLGLGVVDIIVNVIWDKVFTKIVLYIFLPYIMYFLCFISFISFFYVPDIQNQYSSFILLPYCVLYSCY